MYDFETWGSRQNSHRERQAQGGDQGGSQGRRNQIRRAVGDGKQCVTQKPGEGHEVKEGRRDSRGGGAQSPGLFISRYELKERCIVVMLISRMTL